MTDKKQLQEDNFKKLILLNLPPIQTRHIAYQLAEKSIVDFTTKIDEKILTIQENENTMYKVEILDIDIPINVLTKV
jgi:hypothetical protein